VEIEEDNLITKKTLLLLLFKSILAGLQEMH